MDNDDARVGRILSRREALGLVAGATFVGLLPTDAEAGLQAKAQKEVRLVATPALTEGPFFVDEKLERSDLVGDEKRVAVAQGVPLALAVTVYRLAGGRYSPLAGAKVDLWHCDAQGVYSDEEIERTGGQRWLRGFQTTDAKGAVGFKTIVPGCYLGRTTHIHFKVRQGGREFASQWFFDDGLMDKLFAKAPYRVRGSRDVRNSGDGIFRERQAGGTVAGDHLTLVLAPAKEGYEASFAIALAEGSLGGGVMAPPSI